jgi:Glycosyl hydrolases family 2, TIM barrel domain
MRKIFYLLFISYSSFVFSQDVVTVEKNNSGHKLKVNGKDLMINGMNWDYFPIGTNYNYSLWKQSDDVIKAALDTEMTLLQNMGVNVIRQYTGVPAKWVTYIYKNYGIYTMLNHSFGRYGLTISGTWVPNTEYSNPKTRELLLSEVKNMVSEYKNTPGVLLFLLGNENNYGLFWEGAETENIPVNDRKSTIKARSLYKVFDEAVVQMKAIDKSHPIAICNGDLLFLEIIVEECKNIDILGTNMYRGASFGDAFERVKKELNVPLLFTEFGSDAFSVIENQEDQKSQAYFMVENWKEIYQNAAGLGKAENSIGGFTFQFSDGWWKYGQTKNLDVHDDNASWSNGGYSKDYTKGENNMNEEWFGVCAKGKTNQRGTYELFPRAAYYALKEAHNVDPYSRGATLDYVSNAFKNIQLADAVLRARGDKAAMGSTTSEILKISNLRAEYTTYNTGGSLVTTPTPGEVDPTQSKYPNKLGFDHMQSYFIGVEGNPAPNMKANVNVNILGRVAENPINEIFYENRGRVQKINTTTGILELNDVNRVQVYNASYAWNEKDFDLRGFYRTGHYHWGYEGDFFGLYPEANYGPNLDLYNGETLGFEIDGKRSLNGLKAAFGPQLWWGANPAVLLKYSRKIGKIDATAVYHEDIADAGAALTSIAIPLPKTRRATVHFKTKLSSVGLELGGIWGGQPLNGRSFKNFTGTTGNYTFYDDKVNNKDNWGAKAKITFSEGTFNFYTQGAIMGLVANGGADNTQTFTGWRLKDSGSGNQTNILAGFTFNLNSNFQIAPNFLWQKPLVAGMPNDSGRLRNIQADPFVVRVNRETIGGELLLTYDPTPATWMYEWDNDRAEDAKLAISTNFTFRHLPTTQDAAIGFLSNRNAFAFDKSAPAHDLWESNTRLVSKISPNFGLIANLLIGNAQSNGSDERLIERYGGDIRVILNKIKMVGTFKVNDWGPYDYHRDFNLTYPEQLSLDISTTLGKPDWFILPNTQIGLLGTWRTLDKYSPRYTPTFVPPNTFPAVPVLSPVGFSNGNEWEIRTYIHINIGK